MMRVYDVRVYDVCVGAQLQLENEQLYDELNSMVDEVR